MSEPVEIVRFTTTIRHASPKFWGNAIELQLHRVEEMQALSIREHSRQQDGATHAPAVRPGISFYHRTSAEVHFLLVAMRNALRIVRRRAATSKLAAEADAQLSADFPHVGDLRDMLEHLDEYSLGEGRLQQRGEIRRDNRDPHLHFTSATDAAAELEIAFSDERRVPLKAAARMFARVAGELADEEHEEIASASD